jgi:ATP-dependent DNA ligase
VDPQALINVATAPFMDRTALYPTVYLEKIARAAVEVFYEGLRIPIRVSPLQRRILKRSLKEKTFPISCKFILRPTYLK